MPKIHVIIPCFNEAPTLSLCLDRILEVDGVPTKTLQQVTSAFRESRDTVRMKVASPVVYGGWLYKKGELNTTLQLRFFILSDEAEVHGLDGTQ